MTQEEMDVTQEEMDAICAELVNRIGDGANHEEDNVVFCYINGQDLAITVEPM